MKSKLDELSNIRNLIAHNTNSFIGDDDVDTINLYTNKITKQIGAYQEKPRREMPPTPDTPPAPKQNPDESFWNSKQTPSDVPDDDDLPF